MMWSCTPKANQPQLRHSLPSHIVTLTVPLLDVLHIKILGLQGKAPPVQCNQKIRTVFNDMDLVFFFFLFFCTDIEVDI